MSHLQANNSGVLSESKPIQNTITVIREMTVGGKAVLHCSVWSSDPVPGLLLLRGAGRHGGVAVSGPSHPPPHTWTKPHLWLEGDTSARMTSAWSLTPPTTPNLIILYSPQTAVTSFRPVAPNTFPPLYKASQWQWKKLSAWRWEASE